MVEQVQVLGPSQDDDRITVEVLYALPDAQPLIVVRLPREGATALAALTAAGLFERHPGLCSGELLLGCFGERIEPTHPLRDGDRVEVLRPLENDPKIRRRARAEADRKARAQR